MEKQKTQKQIDSLFIRRMNSYERMNKKEISASANIGFGYGMRAYSRFKHMANHTGEIRDKLEDMVFRYKISHPLLAEAVRKRILSADFVNGNQGTSFN